ncbi:MAG: GNAT family N-acetyltransferase [Chitinophaga sp.]|uniref:GNAT family N-acetyltransferase n=1 Tax=Chitinophaga sp. TaxID=1869181 RepID=UPI0025BB7C32|nr:GNAT family N-acetyltransferase [Chitinophaga sp.]MBV8252438.1 GNAT family N-acetyltransferase [Chitinophaga sp.]
MYPFYIRKVHADELSLVLQLLKEAATALQQKGLEQWHVWLQPKPENIAWIEEGLNNQEFFFVENDASEVMGMYRLSYNDQLYWGEQTEKAGYVHSLVVRKQFAGANLGTAMLNYIADGLIQQGIHLFRLDCDAANKWLCNYYESQGFQHVGEKRMPHGLNNLYEKELGKLSGI